MEKSDLPMEQVVEVVYSPKARQVECMAVDLAALPGQELLPTVKDVLLASGLLSRFSELNLEALDMGIWGVRAALDTLVQPGDRIEVYRGLLVDPKEARRLRHQKQAPARSLYRPGYRGKASRG